MGRLSRLTPLLVLLACQQGGDPSPTAGTPTSTPPVDPTSAVASPTPAPPSPTRAEGSPEPSPEVSLAPTQDPGPSPTPEPTPAPEVTPTATPFKICQVTCERAADCAGSSPLDGEDNYTCDDGVCRYLGCHDGECSSGSSCVDIYGSGLPSCVQDCDLPRDCGTDVPSNDADNYACTSGHCEWTGCNSNSECLVYGQGWVCVALGSLSYCVQGCQQPSDCALDPGVYSADNFECTQGGCNWLGCNSTEECTLSLGPRYACVSYYY